MASYKSLLALAMLPMCVLLSHAQEATIFPFLRGTISARSAALAGSTVAMTNDLSSVVLNPAAMYTVEGQRLTGTFIKHVLDINAGYAMYGNSFGDDAKFAVTAAFTSDGTFEQTNAQGATTGSFTSNDIMVAATYSKELDTLISYGITLKLLNSSNIDQNSTAIAFDAGVLFQIPKSRTNVGISLLNAGTQLTTYDGTRDNLPVDLRIGVNHRLKGLPLLFNASINHLADDVDSFFDRFLNFSVGGELYIGKYVQARVGYDNATRNLTGINVATQLTGISAGIGVDLEHLDFDYALSSMGSSAFLHRVSVGLEL